MRQRRVRADGLENRRTVLASARALYAEQGADVPLSAIAERAGVSRTTVSRHFPTRHDLDIALMDENVVQVEAFAQSVLGRPDALRLLFRYVLELQLETNYFFPIDRRAVGDDADRLVERIVAALSACEGAAPRSELAEDTTIDDLVVGMYLNVSLTQPGAEVRAALRTRAWTLLERSLFA